LQYGFTHKFDYDTYAIVTVAKDFADWILEPSNIKDIG